MDFVGSNTWFLLLLALHVIGAIVGLGPTFAFAIIGPAAGKATPEGGLALLEVMEKIEKGMVVPILIAIQLSTGVGLIFNRGLNVDFFSSQRLWLIGGIALYLIAMTLVMGVDLPAMGRAIHLAKSGQGGTPEFMAAIKIPQVLGPILSVLGLGIILLMVWKPGSDCGSLYRC